MNIKIGEKIKKLRQRDGRKQEDLALALGVSPQAVSRWETNVGYPDIEFLPAIANYFNVTIDELFEYSKEKEMKLKSILDKAEKDIDGQGDLSECIEMLRLAAQEFPSEAQVFVKLGYALYMQGWAKYGARSYTEDGSDYPCEDIEYNSKNVYWQEALAAFERVLTIDDSVEDRDAVVLLMVIIYGKMGYIEKAKALSQKQNSIIMSKELLLPKATTGEEGDKYRGEAIIALLTELKNAIEVSIASKVSVFTTKKALLPLMALINLYKAVFNDGNYGIAHSHMRDLYLRAAIQQDRHGEKTRALEYFREAFRHNDIYKYI